jgi:O-antigen/teichoic acid export membrane protein
LRLVLEHHPAMGTLRSSLIAGLADQALVSLGNFAFGVSLARILPIAEYGVYAVTMSFLVFINTLHQAFVIYPLSIRAVSATPPEYSRLLHIALMLSPLATLVLLPALAVALWSTGHTLLLPAAFAAMVAWQAQEVFRRGFLARRNAIAAILLDTVRYLGPLVLIWAIAGITIADVFLCIAAMSAVAIVPLLPSLWRGAHAALSDIIPALVHHWRMAGPVLGANLLYAFAAQWFIWLLAWSSEPSQTAALTALANIAGVVSPILLGVETILVPEIAGIHTTHADRLHHLLRRTLIFGCLAIPPLALIAAFPTESIRIFYGRGTAYLQYSGTLRLMAAIYASYFLATLFSAFLRGIGRVQATFQMQLYPTLIAITAGTVLTLKFGLTGACVGILLCGALRIGLGAFFVVQARHATLPASRAMARP